MSPCRTSICAFRKTLSGLINKLKTRNEEILIPVIFVFTNDKSTPKY